MALRNVFRQKRRSVLTALTMFGGFVLCSFSIAMSDGSYNHVIDMFTRNQMGHIQIHHDDYLDRPSLYKTIDDYEEIGRKLDGVEGITSWTPRIISAGLVSLGEKSAGVQLIGVDPQRENSTTRFDRKVVSGTGLAAEPSRQAVLGKGLAGLIKAEVGDEVVVLSQAADGSIANDLYTVVGLVVTDNQATDLTGFYLHLDDAQELLVLEGRVHEIAILGEELGTLDALADDVTLAVDNDQLDIATWKRFAASFYRAMLADQKGSWISVGVIVIVVAVGVLNTVLMTVLERRREYGLLRAVGTGPGQVFRLVMIEVTILAILSLLIGSLVALALNYYYSITGMGFGQSFSYGGVEFSLMFTEINARSFYIPGLAVLVSAIAVSIIPALRAAHIAPAQSMRTH
jgi:ABC-type lipoprotein release transport system permease subunit